MKTETTSKELRLEFFKELYERAKNAFSDDIEEFEQHLEQYRGSRVIDGSSEEALTVRNVTYEIIESQVSSEIPMPKVDPAVYSDARDRNAHTIEMLCASVRDKLPFEEMNDIDERNTYIFGGGVWLVEWDNSQSFGSEVGGVKVHVISPRDFVPEPCVCRVEDMEYCFIRTRATRGDVMRKYRVADENASLLECEYSAWERDCADDTVSVIICFYRGECGEVGRFIFSGDLTLSDLPDYYRRRIVKCRECGKPAADCRCKKKKLYDESVDNERVSLSAEQLGRIFGGARTRGGVLVFSRGANDGECIRLYTPAATEGDNGHTVFEISEAHRGNYPLGAAINQGNEALYVTKDGLSAIGERSLYRTGSIYPRSTAVAAMLAGEDLTKATLTHWCGYVVLSIGGRMYLADTRAMDDFGRGKEYEWFFLSGVGSYRNDSRVYRYSTMAHHGYIVSETPDAIVKEEVWSEGIDSGIVFFVKSEDGKIEVYPTEEYSGGDFYPAEITLGFDDKLIFSTGCGDVFIFNNDMRGIAPKRIATDPDFDPEEYEKVMGRRIHPDFYAFHNHSPRYALICAYDDCGIPHLKKSTIRSSLTAKLAILGGGHIFCEVGRDGNGYHPVASVDGVSDFSNLSFSASPFACGTSVTVALPEHERGWVEKSIALYSEDFRSPFGVYSICYRYRISGRIKNS